MKEHETLERVEAHLKALVDAAKDAIVSADDSGSIIQFNRTAELLFGYRTREVMGSPLTILMPERFHDAHLRGFERFMATGESRVIGRTVELVGKRKEGSEFPIEMSLATWKAEETVYFTAIIRDLTDRKRSEEEREKFFTASLDLLAIASLDGYLKRLSPSWEETFGWTLQELLARPWLDFVHPEDRAATVAASARLAQGAPVLEFENRYQCRDGSYRWLSWRVPAPAAGSTTLYAAARDVTELNRHQVEIRRLNEELLKKIEEALAANKDLEAFSYSVSHDLRAPLRAIDGYSQLLLEEQGDRLDEEGKRMLKIVMRGAGRMGELIDDLLEFSKTGRVSLQACHLDMNALAEEVSRDLESQNPGRKIEFRLGDLPPSWGDKGLLRQVFVNLLGNAVKYTLPRNVASIEVGGSSDKAENTYWVRDNGVGFDMQYVHKLFGVFQRLHTNQEFEGTGVGLALVQRIIQRHGGKIRAEGRVDQGATFTFSLPGKEGAHGGA
jgi:PAS domain S-box-containing protein